MNDLCSDLPLSAADEFDAFQCSPLVRKIATLFENRAGPPSNIAIYGPWGSGKSSLLYLLKKELDSALSHDAPLWIEIDAWAFQTDDTLIFAILSELYRKAAEPVKESLLRIALGTSLSLADLALKFATDGKLSLEDIEDNLKRAQGAAPLESRHLVLRDEFARVVGKLKKSKKAGLSRHVLIAVDNLDRCKPDAAIKVLETMFLVGNNDDCTFLITVDQHVLISFLNRHYQGTQFNGARYLEKIFPVAFRIPDPWVYWSYTQARNASLGPMPSAPDQVYLFLDRLLRNSDWDDRQKSERDDADGKSIFATVWHYLAQPRILRNPRRIKRVVRIIRPHEPKSQADAEILLFLVILIELWPEAFEYLLSVDGRTWKEWMDGLAGANGAFPVDAILKEDHALRDFMRQVWGFHDPKRQSMKGFKGCPIRKHDRLLYHLKNLRSLGL